MFVALFGSSTCLLLELSLLFLYVRFLNLFVRSYITADITFTVLFDLLFSVCV